MPKYAVLFSFTADTAARFIQNPDDRQSSVSKLLESAERYESYELIAPENLVKIGQKAQALAPTYRPPGQTRG